MRHFARFLFGLLGGCLLSSAVLAQTIPQPQAFEPTDRNGVNLLGGSIKGPDHTISIGQPGQGGLSVTVNLDTGSGGFIHDLAGIANKEPLIGEGSDYPWVYVTVPQGPTVYFQRDVDFSYHLVDGSGELVGGETTDLVYTDLDGTRTVYSRNLRSFVPYTARLGLVSSVTRPDGEVWTFHYQAEPTNYYKRLKSVTSNLGYQIHFEYLTEVQGPEWAELSKITAFNNTVDWCSPTATTCTFSRTWPTLTFSKTTSERTITDAVGNATRYFTGSGGLTGWSRPAAGSGQVVSVTWSAYPHLGKVATVNDGAGTWTYGYTTPPPDNPPYYELLTTIEDPLGHVSELRMSSMFDGPPAGRRVNDPRSFKDAEGNLTSYLYETGRPVAVIYPEGNRIDYGYTDRGDLTSVSRSKPGSGLSPTTIILTYGDCSTPLVCGRPTQIRDARLNNTDYTYSNVHGGVLTETLPAPVAGAVRPQNRYIYSQRQAWFRTSASATQVQGPSVWRRTASSACVAGASCAGTANEVVGVASYQAGSAAVGSNLLPASMSSGSGDGLLTATTATTWTDAGDARTVDGPLAGTADTTWSTYDVIRRPIGVVGPDPDGAGPLGFPATRTTYDASSQVISAEQGTTTGQSDAAFAAFASLRRTDSVYDTPGRKTQDRQMINAGLIAVTQYGYDTASRNLCIAVRMNPATWEALPDACLPVTPVGPWGADRIVHNTYDDADRLTAVRSGYGTTDVRVMRAQTWTANSKIDWMEDGAGNRSDYTYDDFGRLVRLNFPLTMIGAHVANANDYETYGYDGNDNRVSLRMRDNQTLTYTFDALNRETTKTTPGGGTADDVFSTYDNLGRRLAARFTHPTTGAGLVWTWDALGRPLTETAYGRTLTSTYDLAGRRTQLTWPAAAGGYHQFTWDLANRMDQVRENGATSGAGLLADYVYDDLGRRTSLTRGNATGTSWTWTPSSRDWTLSQNLAGTSADATWWFTLNPAMQVRGRTLSNGAAYGDATPMTGATAYVRDGLNRYSAVGGTAFGYDAKGNLTSDGARTYLYDVENRLTTISGSSDITLAYDPLGRLRQTTGASGTTQFLYDGDRLVAEYDGAGALTARYAHGPGPDEPLVWYAGATLTDRRWLHADAQGSIVAASDGTGALVGAAYRYSPFGDPDAANGFAAGSRFRYTGQITLRDAPLWHYKARTYDPRLGRFLQTDPAGYEDSLNLYAYVGNDPLNATDPTGRTARVFVNRRLGVVTVILPVTAAGDTSFAELSAGISSLSQNVTDPAGRDWRVNFAAVEGSMTRGLSTFTNTFRTDEYRRGRQTGDASSGFRSGDDQTMIMPPEPTTATIAHEGALHGSGLEDQYLKVDGFAQPNPNYPADNAANVDANGVPGRTLKWGQVEFIMSDESGNDIRFRD